MGGLEAEPESRRLALLESTRDPTTVRRLEALGAKGSVVAVDIDPRFLKALPENVEVRELDIRERGVETGAYDLVHCRALLMHLPSPAVALARMADALVPGG